MEKPQHTHTLEVGPGTPPRPRVPLPPITFWLSHPSWRHGLGRSGKLRRQPGVPAQGREGSQFLAGAWEVQTECQNTARGGEVRQLGSHSQAQPHGRCLRPGGALELEGSRGGQAGRKHQCHRCTEGVREERFEQLSQEAKDSGWRHWGPDTWQSGQPPSLRAGGKHQADPMTPNTCVPCCLDALLDSSISALRLRSLPWPSSGSPEGPAQKSQKS